MTAGRIAIVVGTRPEIIKMAEITQLLGDATIAQFAQVYIGS